MNKKLKGENLAALFHASERRRRNISAEKRVCGLRVRLTEKEYDEIAREALRCGVSMGQICRDRLFRGRASDTTPAPADRRT